MSSLSKKVTIKNLDKLQDDSTYLMGRNKELNLPLKELQLCGLLLRNKNTKIIDDDLLLNKRKYIDLSFLISDISNEIEFYNKQSLKNIPVITSKTLPILKEYAVKLESTELKVAYDIMNVCNILHPKGLVIKSKLAEYAGKLGFK